MAATEFSIFPMLDFCFESILPFFTLIFLWSCAMSSSSSAVNQVYQHLLEENLNKKKHKTKKRDREQSLDSDSSTSSSSSEDKKREKKKHKKHKVI